MEMSPGFAVGLGLVAVLAAASAASGQSGACCHGDDCLDAADAQSCAAYVCDVAALLPGTFGGCYGDVDGNGFVNAGDRGFISAAIGVTDNAAICQFDLDGNGAINAADRGFVSAAIGQCVPLPDFQNGSGQNGGATDPRFPETTFHPGLACAEVSCVPSQCAAPTWTPGFHLSDMNAQVFALAVFDDGTGPALYAGGAFTTAGDAVANHVAKWDGTAWSPLVGPNGNGMGAWVYALHVFDDGTGPALYAGGSFTTAGGVAANHVAKWDGAAWTPLNGPHDNGVNDRVYALTVFDDGTGLALFAGGFFTTAGGAMANHVAKWNGAAWSPLDGPNGNGIDNWVVYALTVFDDGTAPALYAGGEFITAGGVAANNVAKWDGAAWSPLEGPNGNGMNGRVFDLTVFDDGTGPALYAGGFFTAGGGVAANYAAKWNGAAWSPLEGPDGSGLDNWVIALTVFDDGLGPALYAGGDFTAAGGAAANRLAKWDGDIWSPLTGPDGNGVNNWVDALTVFDDGTGPALYAGGIFTTAGGVHSSMIARWGCEP
jgi:hypothetical protein